MHRGSNNDGDLMKETKAPSWYICRDIMLARVASHVLYLQRFYLDTHQVIIRCVNFWTRLRKSSEWSHAVELQILERIRLLHETYHSTRRTVYLGCITHD